MGQRISSSVSARIRRPVSESGECIPCGVPIRYRWSCSCRAIGCPGGATIEKVSTCGLPVVATQSLSRSTIAEWNSSSRCPRGSSRWASRTPTATLCRSRCTWGMKLDQAVTAIRRAVGTAVRTDFSDAKVCDQSWSSVSGEVSRTRSATGEPWASSSSRSALSAGWESTARTSYSWA